MGRERAAPGACARIEAMTRRAAALARRAVAASPALRRVVKSDPVQSVIRRQRAMRAVRPARAFALNELTRASRPATYELRAQPGLRVCVRHGTRDVEILNEIFGATGGRLAYEPPPAVRSRLRGPIEVVDLGGNVGLFGVDALRRWPGSRIESFEPDPANAAVLRTTAAANAGAGSWTVCEAAVSNQAGRARFETGQFSESRLAGPDGAPSGAGAPATADVAVVDLFARRVPFDLLKIDIEGGEWPILGDPRLAELPAQAIVMEWHRHACPRVDAHAAACDALTRAGYAIVEDAPAPHLRNGMLWAMRA
jgi:FkbM family methyltransferase